MFAHKSPENYSVTDVLVEGCVFGPNLHGTLTLGSECFFADNIVLRNCRLDNDCALLRLKMRPDTYQTYGNIRVENVTGRCGALIEALPWKQFFTLEGTDAHPVGVIRNVTLKDLELKCKGLGVIAANPDDTVENFLIENVRLKADSDIFRCNYSQVTLKNVLVNGKKPKILPADEKMKDSLNFDAVDLDKNNEK